MNQEVMRHYLMGAAAKHRGIFQPLTATSVLVAVPVVDTDVSQSILVVFHTSWGHYFDHQLLCI
jgi:hypothetical protein